MSSIDMIRFAPKAKQANSTVRISDCGHYVIIVHESMWVSGRDNYGGKSAGYWSGAGYSVSYRVDVNADPIYGCEFMGFARSYKGAVEACGTHADLLAAKNQSVALPVMSPAESDARADAAIAIQLGTKTFQEVTARLVRLGYPTAAECLRREFAA